MNRIFTSLLYTLLPGHCVICKAPSHRKLDLCLACENELPSLPSPCIRCGLPIPAVTAKQPICGECAVRPPGYDRMFCAFAYVSPINILIRDFKNGHNLVFGKVLAQILARKYKESLKFRQSPHILIPVPLHKNRLKLRGFNQAAEIAQVISDICNIRTTSKICTRDKDTSDQKGLPAIQRQENVEHVFTLNRNLEGYRVAIVDDVVTTGATVTALAKLAKNQGASSIEVIALARTPRR